MKPLIFTLGAVLTTAIVFFWICARFADMRPVVDAHAASPVGNGPYTPKAERPPAGSRGPLYSVTKIGGIRPDTSTTTITSHQGAGGAVTTAVIHQYRHDQAPSGLPGKRLRPLPGYQYAVPLAVNRHGQVVGYCESIGSGAWTRVQDRALLWRRGRLRALGTLPGYQITHAVAISDGGVIVGDATIDSFPADRDIPGHAVCWVKGRVQDLGTGWAIAVSSAGEIVGDSGTGPAEYPHAAHALLWIHGYRYDLNDRIPARSGWLLEQATHIDDHGRITGLGTFRGSPGAFLLTPRRRG